MKIVVGCDEAAYQLKELVRTHLEKLGHEVVDVGVYNEDPSLYPDTAERLCARINSGECERGVLMCGTGIGMAIAADKIAGVRASSITTPDFADLFRRHNDGNVVCLSGRFVDVDVNKDIVKVFLTSEFEGGRHAQRVAKMMKLDSTGKAPEGQKPRVMPLNR